MLFKSDQLKKIHTGEITCAIRKWKRPTVKTGGRLLTPVGELEILEVVSIAQDQITSDDLRKSGFDDMEKLAHYLNRNTSGQLYRIRFRLLGEDPRIALRNQTELSSEDFTLLRKQLKQLDERSVRGPWTHQVMEWIWAHPGMRAGDMADTLGFEKMWIKRQIRKLKSKGLTISLGTGYSLSPRGEVFRKMVGKNSC